MGAKSEARFIRYQRDYFDRQLAARPALVPVAWHVNIPAVTAQLAAHLRSGRVFVVATRVGTVSVGPYASASAPEQFAIFDERNAAHCHATAEECADAFARTVHPATIYAALRRVAALDQ